MGGEPWACDGRDRGGVGVSLLGAAVGVEEGVADGIRVGVGVADGIRVGVGVADGIRVGVGVVDAGSEDGLTAAAG